jgi:chromosome condensin MukBEF ATPase and DNA-binding subunit MukB
MTFNLKRTREWLAQKKRERQDILDEHDTIPLTPWAEVELSILDEEIMYLENELAKGSRHHGK